MTVKEQTVEVYVDHEEQTIAIIFENVQNWSHCQEKSTNI